MSVLRKEQEQGQEQQSSETAGSRGIDEPLRRFIVRNLDSLEGLEVLLLLHRSPERAWSAEEVAQGLGIPQRVAAQRLEELGSRGLLDVRIAQDLLYRYAPANVELARGADDLAEAYSRQRLAVMNLIVNRPLEPVRDFSEAFRIKKKDGE